MLQSREMQPISLTPDHQSATNGGRPLFSEQFANFHTYFGDEQASEDIEDIKTEDLGYKLMTKSPSITEYNLNLEELLQGTHQSSKTETVYQSFKGRPDFDLKGANTAS